MNDILQRLDERLKNKDSFSLLQNVDVGIEEEECSYNEDETGQDEEEGNIFDVFDDDY